VDYKRLFVLLEGNDDERFFKKIIKPEFDKRYDSVQFYLYAAQSPKKIENFIKSIIAMKANYIIVTDINKSPCVTHRKGILIERKIKNRRVTNENIMVVIKEIESWYLAGLPPTNLQKLKINYREKNTDSLTKEKFDRLIPGKFISRIDFMQEILKYFQIETAKQNNKSFHYFMEKFAHQEEISAAT
jgi:hypothetical protein